MITRTTDARGGAGTLRGRVALLVIPVTLPLGALLLWDAREDRTLVVAVLLLLGIWLVATFAIRRVLRPLDQIVSAAAAVAAGDPLAAMHVGGPREIGEIAPPSSVCWISARRGTPRCGRARPASMFQRSRPK